MRGAELYLLETRTFYTPGQGICQPSGGSRRYKQVCLCYEAIAGWVVEKAMSLRVRQRRMLLRFGLRICAGFLVRI